MFSVDAFSVDIEVIPQVQHVAGGLDLAAVDGAASQEIGSIIDDSFLADDFDAACALACFFAGGVEGAADFDLAAFAAVEQNLALVVRVQGLGANLLGIKPALEVINGELKVVKKYRGSLPICVGKYITDRLVERDDIEDSLVFISSCQPKPGCMDAVKAGLKKYGSFKECHETDIGTTIGGYSGPGTIGIVFARKEK